ncbi:DUF3168 domain-containing protein [Pusillimonas sp. DMV24BSW_D]|uniref:tail completion protein gp17 n=1 Tax=Neopusillimonas aestuarii TaxID=2716226 RepID=UPI001408E8E8|nr:DUF3168 domain-containing protein [Pusillimonas sp. DMV24BSW_D]QIM48988.1 DUF3168 domain-containing protein [Pusillimonas sp. DMV24BSW_D]
MSLETDLRTALLPLVNAGVHFGVVPVDKLPTDANRMTWTAIVLPTQIVTPENTICGASDMEDYRVQIDAYAGHPGVLAGLRAPIFSAIDATFEHAERINDVYEYDADTKLHRRMIEYSIRF